MASADVTRHFSDSNDVNVLDRLESGRAHYESPVARSGMICLPVVHPSDYRSYRRQ